jgi:hypothetical protein
VPPTISLRACSTNSRTFSIGTIEARLRNRAVVMPATWPSNVKSGPPELPGLMLMSLVMAPFPLC